MAALLGEAVPADDLPTLDGYRWKAVSRSLPPTIKKEGARGPTEQRG
jgi:hypothetical protein